MKASARVLVALFALGLGARAAQAAVLRVVTVETTDVALYLKEIERGNALLKRGGSPTTMRVWRGQFAGREAGQVVVQLEYPDLAALAKDNEKFSRDPEMQAWL